MGRKLGQHVYDSLQTLKKKSDYAGEFFYENYTLQIINHEEGRVVMVQKGQPIIPEYQYHLKDHLGNMRTTFTTKEETDEAIASNEVANSTEENGQFINYDNARFINSDLFDHTKDGQTAPAEGAYSQRLSGSANEKLGLARSLSVMPGDKIDIEVYAKWYDASNANNDPDLNALIAAIATGSALPARTVVDGAGYAMSANNTLPFASGLDKSAESGTVPKAYLNWMVFNRDYEPDMSRSGYKRITNSSKEDGSDVDHDYLHPNNTIEIAEPGFVYIWLNNENETAVEVYFDDFKVTQTKSPIIQTQDYYPFGLTFNDYQRENSLINQYKYNGKELQDELGLNLEDYGSRMYDPTCGCWHNIDPVADAYYSNSPYSYVLGNPVSNQDEHGMWTVSRHHKMTLDALSSVGIGGVQAGIIAHYASVYADNPGGHIVLDNLVNPTTKTMYYRDDIDYSRTANSQNTGYAGAGYNYNIWHSMRSGTEKNAYDKGVGALGISAKEAMQRGLKFGWDKVFSSAGAGKLSGFEKNSRGIQDFGQGLHALQDAYAHHGRHDVSADHILNDMYGDSKEAEAISQSAVVVHKLLTSDFSGITSDHLNIVTEGMSSEQISTVMKQIGKFLNQRTEKKDKSDEK